MASMADLSDRLLRILTVRYGRSRDRAYQLRTGQVKSQDVV
jgi:hypothetical protein